MLGSPGEKEKANSLPRYAPQFHRPSLLQRPSDVVWTGLTTVPSYHLFWKAIRNNNDPQQETLMKIVADPQVYASGCI